MKLIKRFNKCFECVCGCVRRYCGKSACVSICQAQTKTRATVRCILVSVCCQCVCVCDSVWACATG